MCPCLQLSTASWRRVSVWKRTKTGMFPDCLGACSREHVKWWRCGLQTADDPWSQTTEVLRKNRMVCELIVNARCLKSQYTTFLFLDDEIRNYRLINSETISMAAFYLIISCPTMHHWMLRFVWRFPFFAANNCIMAKEMAVGAASSIISGKYLPNSVYLCAYNVCFVILSTHQASNAISGVFT